MRGEAIQSAVETIAHEIAGAPGDQFAMVREVYRAIEGHVLRAALERGAWGLRAAMRQLGVASPETVSKALRRHPELDEERRRSGRKTTARDDSGL